MTTTPQPLELTRPFLLLSTRPEDPTAEGEYANFRDAMGLTDDQLIQVRMELGPYDFPGYEHFSGIVLGGGPFNNTEPVKTPTQQRVEAELATIVGGALERDFPLFGACYGVGVVGTAIGATLGREYAEEPGPRYVHLTDAGIADPILAGISPTFEQIIGHKENISALPDTFAGEPVVRLATGDFCPVQMFRVRQNTYVTQFHPELDHHAFNVRIETYRDYGYYPPEDVGRIIGEAARWDIESGRGMLRNFATRYAR